MRVYLILDDSVTDKRILAYLLEELTENPPEIHSFSRGEELVTWLSDQQVQISEKEIVIYCDQNLKPETGKDILSQVHAEFPELLVYPVLMSGELHWTINAPKLPHPVGLVEKLGDLTLFQDAISKNLQLADQFFSGRRVI